MDNLSSHKDRNIRDMIEAVGAALVYLSAYSHDFNPIQNTFAKLKALLRKAAERTIEGSLGHHRFSDRPIYPTRIRKLLHRRRVRCKLNGKCSNAAGSIRKAIPRAHAGARATPLTWA